MFVLPQPLSTCFVTFRHCTKSLRPTKTSHYLLQVWLVISYNSRHWKYLLRTSEINRTLRFIVHMRRSFEESHKVGLNEHFHDGPRTLDPKFSSSSQWTSPLTFEFISQVLRTLCAAFWQLNDPTYLCGALIRYRYPLWDLRSFPLWRWSLSKFDMLEVWNVVRCDTLG